MLENIFLQILNMSFTASFVIIFVLLARLFLKKSPKPFSYVLWGVVLFRLICPFNFESMFSLLPSKANPISQDIVYKATPTIDTGISAINNVVNSSLPAANPSASINPLQVWVFMGTTIWLLGITILLIYSIVSLVRLQRRLKFAVKEGDNIYLSEHLETPFVMGIIRPKIYMPTSLTDKEKRYILLHEEMHIRRFDHVVRILSFLVLCLHWFNPLVWVTFFVSGRDMEMSCDEAVIRQLGSDVKKDYSSSLLTLSTGRRIIGGAPLAFGEGNTKARIKNVLNYKKSTFWVVALSFIIVLALGIGFATNQKTEKNFEMSGNYLSDLQPDEIATNAMFSSESSLSFRVKQDESPESISEEAAIQWLNSYMGEKVPISERISDYTIEQITVLGSSESDDDTEAYTLHARVQYEITTATEEYSAPEDGISGKGTFGGLFRDLNIKMLDKNGNFAIVSVSQGASAVLKAELEVFNKLGILIHLPENENWIGNPNYSVIDAAIAQVEYYDKIIETDMVLRAGREDIKNLSGIWYSYDVEKDENWFARTFEDGIPIDIKVQRVISDKDMKGVLASWSYKEINYTLWGSISDNEVDISPIAKTAVYIANHMR